MITKQQHNGFIKVEEYSLAAWLAEIEQVINQGYKFDFVDNANYPVGYGSMYTAVLVPVVANEAEKVTHSATPDVPSEITVDEVTPVQTKRKNAKV